MLDSMRDTRRREPAPSVGPRDVGRPIQLTRLLPRSLRTRAIRYVVSSSYGPKALEHKERFECAATRLSLALRDGRFTNLSGCTVFVNLHDARGVDLARFGGQLDDGLIKMWRNLRYEVEPTKVLDVGANYGEVTFSTEYPADSSCFLFEPNPAVLIPLTKTVQANHRQRCHVIPTAAGASNGTIQLLIDPNWSGTSTTVSSTDKTLIEVEVRIQRVDDVVKADGADRVLAKIDVEGAECSVLEGAAELAANAGVFVAICEFEHVGLEDLRRIAKDFEIWLVSRSGTLSHRVDPAVIASVDVGTDDFLKDMVLVHHESRRRHPELLTSLMSEPAGQ